MVVAVDRKTKKSAWAGGRNSLNTVGSFHSFLQTSNISSDEENGLNSWNVQLKLIKDRMLKAGT